MTTVFLWRELDHATLYRHSFYPHLVLGLEICSYEDSGHQNNTAMRRFNKNLRYNKISRE